jgi:hypothetical protein
VWVWWRRAGRVALSNGKNGDRVCHGMEVQWEMRTQRVRAHGGPTLWGPLRYKRAVVVTAGGVLLLFLLLLLMPLLLPYQCCTCLLLLCCCCCCA